MKALVVGLGIVLSIGLARAQAPTPPPKTPPVTAGSNAPLPQQGQDPWDTGVTLEQKQAAARLFEQGNTHLNDGLSAKAAETYRAALKLWPHPAIHYNLALSLLNLDQIVQVEEHLLKAVEHGLKGLNNQEDKLDRAADYLKLIAGRLATVEVRCKKEGAKVSIDNKEVFVVKRGQPNVWKGRLPTGKHTFVAEKEGYATHVDAPYVESGRSGRPYAVELVLYTGPELTRHKRRWQDRAWAPWVVVGGGAVVALAGGGMQLWANSKYSEFDDEVARCNAATENQNGGCDASTPGLKALRDGGDQRRTLGYVAYGVGGAALAAGVLLVYLNRERAYQITTEQYRTEELQKQRKQPSVSITPLVAPTMAGAILFGRF